MGKVMPYEYFDENINVAQGADISPEGVTEPHLDNSLPKEHGWV